MSYEYFLFLLTSIAGLFVPVWYILKFFFPSIIEDFKFIFFLARSLKLFKKLTRKKKLLCDRVAEIAKNRPEAKFLLYNSEEWSYLEMFKWMNKHGRVLKKLGIEPFDKIALMMMNQPSFLAIWFGANNIGATTAFINYQLRLKSLLHCIDVSEAKVLVIGSDLAIVEAVKEIEKDLIERKVQIYVYDPVEDCTFESFSNLLANESSEEIPKEWRGDFSDEDNSCYIYTSGTTGLPKAVNFKTSKAWKGAAVGVSAMNLTREDVIYVPLPLYHAAAAAIGVGLTLMTGCSMVLRKKFSASQLWPDCRRHKVTIVQYIGETMRYVCSTPQTSSDRNHCVRAIIGNGLRPDVWRTFLDRYGDDIKVFELYAATEGNIGFINLFNDFACVGKLTPICQQIIGAYIIKYNAETEEVVRDQNGRAILADFNEPGLVIGQIKKNFEISSYKGAKELTEKKILSDVFKKGDRYFNSGDLMMRDDKYRVFFCDRVGDTYRWKGENVSTNEVGDILSKAPQIYLANVYGVEVKGTEGRAGMAALILNENETQLDTKVFYEYITSNLPVYARPVFLRVEKDLEMTGTFKLKKNTLKSQSFRPLHSSSSTLYINDHVTKSFKLLTDEIYELLEKGDYSI